MILEIFEMEKANTVVKFNLPNNWYYTFCNYSCFNMLCNMFRLKTEKKVLA